MADITVTAANVRGSAGTTMTNPAGFAAVPGKAVMVNATGKIVLSDNNAAGLQQVDGITLASAAVDQPIVWQRGGKITFGVGVLVAGTTYYLSDTPGGICPETDVGTGEKAIVIGVAESTSVLALTIRDTGVTR